MWPLLIVLVVVLVGVTAYNAEAWFTRLQLSSAADRLGMANVPSGNDIPRLRHTVKLVEPLLSIFRDKWPDVRVTSGYRSEDVNRAVGGVADSRHRHGLAVDFGRFGDFGEVVAAVKHLQANVHRLPPPPATVSQWLRTVLAESTPPHVHVSVIDPLGELDAPDRVTRWRQEQEGGGFAAV